MFNIYNHNSFFRSLSLLTVHNNLPRCYSFAGDVIGTVYFSKVIICKELKKILSNAFRLACTCFFNVHCDWRLNTVLHVNVPVYSAGNDMVKVDDHTWKYVEKHEFGYLWLSKSFPVLVKICIAMCIPFNA